MTNANATTAQHITLHNPTDPQTAVYQFDSIEAAQAFKEKHCLSAYRVACVELFAENGSVSA